MTHSGFFGKQDLADWERAIGLVPGASELLAIVRGAQRAERTVELGQYAVGPYNILKEGAQAGLDVHHVGQKALMLQFIESYDMQAAPSILVPKHGHTIRGEEGIVSRSMSGPTSARDVVARDVRELRRVYPDISNSTLQQLIDLNKQVYPREMTR